MAKCINDFFHFGQRCTDLLNIGQYDNKFIAARPAEHIALIKAVLQALGQLHLWQLAIKPGKPFAYGSLGKAHFIGLPGNPVSSFVTFLLLVRPFVLRLQGVAQLEAPRVPMRADFDWARPDKRQEFLRVRRNGSDGLDLYPNQSSGVLTSVVWGDGLIDNPGGNAINRGDTVRFIPLAELLV